MALHIDKRRRPEKIPVKKKDNNPRRSNNAEEALIEEVRRLRMENEYLKN